jgi:hypothetical protein
MTTRTDKHYPSMTAQDFFFIADVLASITADRPSKGVVVAAFAGALAHTNPNFRHDLFVGACNRKEN